MNAKLDTDDADVKGEDARSVRFRTCRDCKKCKPLDRENFHYRTRAGRAPSFHRQCIECRREVERACAKRRSAPGYQPARGVRGRGERSYKSTVKVCGACCGLPWRVTGPQCRRCQLPYSAEPAPELVFRRFDDIRTRC